MGFLDEYKAIAPESQNQATGLLGFLQSLNKVGNAIADPAGYQQQQNHQTLLQTLATLPEAEALQGPSRNAALQFLANNKIDDFQQTVNQAKKSRKDQELGGAVNDILTQRGPKLDPVDHGIAQALLKSGDPMAAVNYLNSALGRVKSEEASQAAAANAALNEQQQNLKGKDNKAVQNRDLLVQQLSAAGASGEDISAIDPNDANSYLQFNLNKKQAAEVQRSMQKIQKETNAKVGGPSVLDRIYGLFPGQTTPGTLDPQTAVDLLPKALVTPQDQTAQDKLEAQRTAINNAQMALHQQQAGKSFFSPGGGKAVAAPQVETFVQMKTPDGVVRNVPASKVKEALKRGAIKVGG